MHYLLLFILYIMIYKNTYYIYIYIIIDYMLPTVYKLYIILLLYICIHGIYIH